MSNPAGVTRMLLGVCEDSWRRPMADALAELRMDHVWVVHGHDGMDEITTTSRTSVSEVRDGKVRDFDIASTDYGIETASLDALRGGKPQENAQALRGLLDGKESAYRDIVRLNAGAALMIAGEAETIEAGIKKATQAIDSHAAKATLAKLVEETNR